MADTFDTDALSDRLAEYARPITIGVVALAAVVSGNIIWKRTQANNASKAEAAFFEASRPFEQGNFAEAVTSLDKVAKRYASSPAGRQAALLQAQSLYRQGKHAEGMQLLDKMGNAKEFEAARHALLAAGAEDQGRFDEAARHYEMAASASRFDLDREQFQADQARALMAAGKGEASAKLWTKLAEREESPFSAEARVRLGEIRGQGSKN